MRQEDNLHQICRQFQVEGKYLEIVPHGEGHIHSTFVARDCGPTPAPADGSPSLTTGSGFLVKRSGQESFIVQKLYPDAYTSSPKQAALAYKQERRIK